MYGYLQKEYINDGREAKWPTTIDAAHTKLLNWVPPVDIKPAPRPAPTAQPPTKYGTTNTTTDDLVDGDLDMLFTVTGLPKCFICQQPGHKKDVCPHRWKSKEELQRLFPGETFCTIANETTFTLPTKGEPLKRAGLGKNHNGPTMVNKKIGMAATTTEEAMSFLQAIQEEYDSDEMRSGSHFYLPPLAMTTMICPQRTG